MKRIWKVGLALLLVGIVAGFLGMEYLNRVVLPVKLKGWAETELSRMTGRQVTVGRVRIHLWHGVLVEQITVEEDARYGKGPFLQIDQVVGKVLFLPLFKEKRVIIPSIRIVRLRTQILQDSNRIWNFESLRLAAATPAKTKPARFQVVVPKVILEDSQLQVGFETPTHRVRLNFQEIDARVGIAFPAKLQATVRARLGAGSGPSIPFQLGGSWDPKTREFSLEGHSLVPLEKLKSAFPLEPISSLPEFSGLCKTQVEASGNPKGPLSLRLAVETTGLQWKLPEGLEGKGDLQARLEAKVPMKPEANLLNYLIGRIELKGISLGPIPSIGSLQELQGEINLTPQGLRAEQLTARLASGEPLTLAGSIANDPARSFSFEARAVLALSRIASFLPALEKNGLAGAKWGGNADLIGKGEGRLKPVFSLRSVVTAAVREGALDLPGAGSFRQVEGKIRWEPDLLTVTALKGIFWEKPFSLEGSWVNFNQPEIDGRIRWDRLETEFQVGIDGRRIDLNMLSGRWGRGSFQAFGEILNGKEPEGNLYGEASLELEELPALLPHPPAWLVSSPLKGPVSARWQLQGKLLTPADWDLGLKLNSPQLSYQKIRLTDLALDLAQQEGRMVLRSGTGRLAEGMIRVNGSGDFLNAPGRWAGELRAENLNLAVLSRDLEWKTQNLSGQLSLNFKGKGQTGNLAALQGDGAVLVQGGQILELPFLGRFADLLKIPSLRSIAFQEAGGTYQVRNGEMITEAFKLKSPRAILVVTGSGGFLQGLESPIRWQILPTLSLELIPEESSKVGRAIAQGASYLVGELRITGTWKEPKSTFVPKPLTQILNEQLFDNVQDLLKDLF